MDDGCSVPFILAAIVIVIIMCVTCSSNVQRADYESEYNGVCPNCEGTLIYQQAIGHKDSTAYIFKCEKCNNLYEIDSHDTDGQVIYYSDGETRPSTTYETYEDETYYTEEEYYGNESMNETS